MEESQSILSERLNWLDNHFQGLVSLIPAEDYYAKSTEDNDDDHLAPKRSRIVKTVLKKRDLLNGQLDGQKQQINVGRIERVTGGKKKEKKLMGREQIVKMIRKQRGDDSGVDSNGSVDLEEKECPLREEISGRMEVGKIEEEDNTENISTDSHSKGKVVNPRRSKKQTGKEVKTLDKESGIHLIGKIDNDVTNGSDNVKSSLSKNKTQKKKVGNQEHSEIAPSRNPELESSDVDALPSNDYFVETNEKSPKTSERISDSEDETIQLPIMKSGDLKEKTRKPVTPVDEDDLDSNDTKYSKQQVKNKANTSSDESEDDESEDDESDDDESDEDAGDEDASDEEMMMAWSGSDGEQEDAEDKQEDKPKEIEINLNQDLREKVRSKIEAMKQQRKGQKKEDKNRKLKEQVKEMRREKKKTAADTRKDLKKKEVENRIEEKARKREIKKYKDSEDMAVQFSKFTVEADELSRKKLSKKAKNMIEKQTGRNYKVLLDKAEKKLEKYENLKEQDPDSAADWLSKEKWRKAVLKASGAKIKDDPDLLKKSLQRTEKRKNRSRMKMKDMEDKVLKGKKERQLKRYRNLQERKHQKKAKKVKRLQKKGKLLLADRDKM